MATHTNVKRSGVNEVEMSVGIRNGGLVEIAELEPGYKSGVVNEIKEPKLTYVQFRGTWLESRGVSAEITIGIR